MIGKAIKIYEEKADRNVKEAKRGGGGKRKLKRKIWEIKKEFPCNLKRGSGREEN